MTDKLVDALDESALLMLESIKGGAKDESGKLVKEALKIQTEVFSVIVDWYKVRRERQPATEAPKEPSKHERLKAEFNGASSKRRRNRRATIAPESEPATAPADRRDPAADGDDWAESTDTDDEPVGAFAVQPQRLNGA